VIAGLAPGWPPRRPLRAALGVAMAVVAVHAAPTAARAQSLLERPARLVVADEPRADALRLLQERAGVPLVYSPDLLPGDRVSCDCRDRTVAEALQQLLAGTGLTFRATRTQVLITPGQPSDVGGTATVTGRVVDDESDVPVGSVQVRVDTGQGGLADESGWFAIRNVPVGSRRLEVTGIGWAPWVREGVSAGAEDTVPVVVRLRRAPVPLPEIIVAPGTFGILESVPPGTVRTITREEIETMPQLGEDVFRSLTRLAGVTAHDISTRLSIRGSLDREVMVRLDGMELYEPYHLRDWDGVFGIVDLSTLSAVELKAGGYGVEYGNRGAGLLNMTSATTVGPSRSTASLNVSHLSFESQGGFAGDRGSWLVSGREGSLGLLMKLIGADRRLSPRFYDVFAKVAYQPSRGQLLAAHVLHAGDRFHLDVSEWDGISVGPGIEAGRIRSDWSSSYAWITWDAGAGGKATSHARVWAGRLGHLREGYVEDVGSIGTPEEIAVRDDGGFRFAGLREQVDVELAPEVLVRVGGEALHARADYDYYARTETPAIGTDRIVTLRSDTMQVTLAPAGHRLSAFAAARTRLWRRFVGEVGVRYDRASQTDEAHLAPRAEASLELGPRTTLQMSAGRYVQLQGVGELQVGDGQTLYAPAERSDLFAVGLERKLGDHSVRLEAYDRRISDQQPRFIGLRQELTIFPEQQGDRLRIDPGRGRARGVELFVEGSAGPRWHWSASYALAKAEDEIPQTSPCAAGPTCLDDPWVPRSRDQRHSIDLQAEFRPDDRWRLSAAWIFHTGWPATAWAYGAVLRADGTPFFTRTFGPLDGERLPAYHRLDVRATRAFQLRGGTLEAYADLFNVYDRRNRGSYNYAIQYLGGDQLRTVRTDGGEELLPFLPMIGLRYRF
jgi:hypothetical protein